MPNPHDRDFDHVDVALVIAAIVLSPLFVLWLIADFISHWARSR